MAFVLGRVLVKVTRRGRTVAYVLSEMDMQELMSLRQRREEPARWYSRYRRTVSEQTPAVSADALTDADVTALLHELR